MTRVTKRYRFSASHRLHVDKLTPEQNQELYGKCNNPFGHGHDYVLEVTCEGPVDEQTGLVAQLGKLDLLVQKHVLDLFAFRYVNADVQQFKTLVPTTENIILVVADLLKSHWREHIPKGVRLARVHIQETGRNGFELKMPAFAPQMESKEYA